MEISGDEKTVVKEAAERAALLMPDCKRVDIPAAKHEIWMEQDALRGQWLKEVQQFVSQRLGGVAPTPKKSNTNNRKPPGMG
jgi:alpha-beta hydrolase superfamily lysophospholipase